MRSCVCAFLFIFICLHIVVYLFVCACMCQCQCTCECNCVRACVTTIRFWLFHFFYLPYNLFLFLTSAIFLYFKTILASRIACDSYRCRVDGKISYRIIPYCTVLYRMFTVSQNTRQCTEFTLHAWVMSVFFCYQLCLFIPITEIYHQLRSN